MNSRLSRTSLIIYAVLLLPVSYCALRMAPYLSGGLPAMAEGLGKMFSPPYTFSWCDDSPRSLIIFLIIYICAVAVYVSYGGNFRDGTEHGSAMWGNVKEICRKYMDRIYSRNILLTDNVRIGLDGYKHKRNLNVLVCGGSGSGKTRFYAKPNLMQLADPELKMSAIVLDPNSCIL